MKPFDYVDPLINTSKPKPRWVFFQSASRPFGMIQLQPDTDTDGTWGVGYKYDSPKVRCFSHIHQWQLSGIPVLPFSGDFTDKLKEGYDLNHDGEVVKPGYHKLCLDECDITAELTASVRVGMHRYTYSKAGAGIYMDFAKSLGPSEMAGMKIERSGNRLTGHVINAPTVRRHKPCDIYFCIDFNTDIKDFTVREDSVIMTFDGKEILMKVAVSYVGESQAVLNMETEIPHWNFDLIVDEAKAAWESILNRVQVKGGTEDQKTKFYSDLWRTTFGGHIISDTDGKWCDNTGDHPVTRQVPLNPDGSPEYDFISNADIFWGAHWSLSIIWDLIFPEIKSAYCRSLIELYRHGGLIGRGPSGGNYTFVMIGAHSGAFIISAHMKGILDFDIETAYEGIKRNARPGGLMARIGYESRTAVDGRIEEFIDKGYIAERKALGTGFHCDGAAQTIEYCFDHWCTAQLAKKLGHDEDYDYFMKLSQNYRNLYDDESGFIRPRNQDGSFINPFDPLSKEGFCEGNSWGYSYYVPHDLPGLIELMGGREAFIEKLNYGFEMAGEMNYYAAKPELRRDKAYINYGNENTRFHAALFSHAGNPALTQKWSREVKDSLFSNTGKKGFCEDDDCGLSGGTSLLLALGLFDVKGGAYENPVYEIGSPVFDEIEIQLSDRYYGGGTFTMVMEGNGPDRPYVNKITLNGKNISEYIISHDDVTKGGSLVMEMSDTPG